MWGRKSGPRLRASTRSTVQQGFEFLGQREVVAEASILGEVGRPISLSR
jgi:response regulator of citrate/malate metabolism